jgi:hypothetical protein
MKEFGAEAQSPGKTIKVPFFQNAACGRNQNLSAHRVSVIAPKAMRREESPCQPLSFSL